MFNCLILYIKMILFVEEYLYYFYVYCVFVYEMNGMFKGYNLI